MAEKISVFDIPLVKILQESYEYNMFSGVPIELEKYVGDDAGLVLREISRKSFLKAMKEETELKKAVKQFKRFEDVFTFCYKMLELLGFEFKYEVLKETKTEYQQKVTACPHIKFTKKNPIACNACLGMKLAILQTLFGEKFKINTPKRMALGDQYCLFKVKK